MLDRFLPALVAGLVLALGVAGTALAAERPGAPVARDAAVVQDDTALCERLEAKAKALRAEIGRIEAVQARIRQKIASGELTRRQLIRAKHALRRLEVRQTELKGYLVRVLHVYEEKCS